MFVPRIHSTNIELAPDEERLYRLPPMSNGTVIVRVFRAAEFRPGPHGQLVHIPEGAPQDLELELRHSEHLKLPFPGGLILTESLWHDDLWRLRVKRKRTSVDPAAPSTPRRYRIEAQYTSQLQLVERKIEASFFHDGFESNYNRQQYVSVNSTGKSVEINFTDDFAQLHGLETIPIAIPDGAKMHNLNSHEIRFDIGAGPVPGGGGTAVFLAAHATFKPGAKLELDCQSDHDFGAVTLSLRLYLTGVFAGLLRYVPEFVKTDALDFDIQAGAGEVLNPFDSTNVMDIAKQTIEAELNKLQARPSGSSKLGEFLTPWLIGDRSELLSIGYEPGPNDRPDPAGVVEPATGKLIVRSVGRKPPPNTEPVLTDADGGGTAPVDDGAIRLFDVPAEDPDPLPGGGGGGGLGGVGGLGGLPLGPKPDIGALAKIEHIVVLMQENRSFDQVFGYLSRDKINPKVEGLLPPDHPDHEKQVNRFNGRNFFPRKADKDDPRRPDPSKAVATAWPSFDLVGPCHNFDCITLQMAKDENGIDMGGFVKDFANRVGATSPALRLAMDYFDAEQLPFYALLAREFGISDRWYCSHVGSTFPNRFVYLTGDLNTGPDGRVELDNPDLEKMIPIQTPTILDHLNDLGVPWRVYEHNYSFPRLFKNFTFDVERIVPFDDPGRGFEIAARDGLLPPVTLIEPDYIDLPPGNDDHPPADMVDGQILIERIVKALVNSPLWEKTLLVITYDEHGGFYDHRQPPSNAPPLRNNSGKLGPRVPALFISPLIERGAVFFGLGDSGRFFDHTSIGATILRRFARRRPPRVSPRMDAARDLREVLTLAQPRPRSDFDAIRNFVRPPRAAQPRSAEARSGRIGIPRDKAEDFHWFLAGTRLTTGQPPRESPLRRRPPGMNSGELLYYRDKTRDGTGDVANPSVIGLGGWQAMRFLFSGENGILYAVDKDGRLLFYRDKTRDGTGDVANPSVIGQGGWQNMKFLFSGGEGIIYAVDPQGRLLFYRDRAQNGTGDVANPAVIGQGGWQAMRFLFSGGDGIIYAVDTDGRLLFYRDKTRNGTGDVANPSVIGQGGWQNMKFLLSGEDGIIYAVDRDGKLLFYRDRTRDGTGDVANPSVIGLGGWQKFKFLLSGGNGILYAVVP